VCQHVADGTLWEYGVLDEVFLHESDMFERD
jgi:hypothetical protein